MRKITLLIVLLGYCFCGEDKKDKKLERQMMGGAGRPNIGKVRTDDLKVSTPLQNMYWESIRANSVSKSKAHRPAGHLSCWEILKT